jgi:hypothetical protein
VLAERLDEARRPTTRGEDMRRSEFLTVVGAVVLFGLLAVIVGGASA